MKVRIANKDWTRLLSGIYVGVADCGKIEVLTNKEFNKLYSHNLWWSKVKERYGI